MMPPLLRQSSFPASQFRRVRSFHILAGGATNHSFPLTYRAVHSTMRHMVRGGTEKMMAQMRRGAIEYCVLALLRDQDRYGLELTRALTDADGLVTSEGTVYPLLTRLRQEGLVETTWEESRQGPPRRYYRITNDGRHALKAFIVQWERFRKTVDGLMA
jgi:PadR family transcriptional regulator, regulatory protein PadR